MAERKNVPLDPRTKKKKTAGKPRTASAYGRAVKKKKQRVNLEPPRPMAARLNNQLHCRLFALDFYEAIVDSAFDLINYHLELII